MQYAPSRSISVLLTEKDDAAMFFPYQSNLLIQATKTIDHAIVGVEIVKQLQCLRVHGMSLERYLRPRKMELLKKKVESSIGILLKTISCWLGSKDCLK